MPNKKSGSNKKAKRAARYGQIIERIFHKHYKPGVEEFEFVRDELIEWATKLGIKIPKNLGDILYTFRFRAPLPNSILKTESGGKEWYIKLAGRGKYKFKLGRHPRITPSQGMIRIKIPDSTPQIIVKHAKTDEQAVLARVRYNRLIDLFLGLNAYSLQNHLRTTVTDIGQIEIDELYVGVRKTGEQFVIPVQAKGGSDKIAAAQLEQDAAYCNESFPSLGSRLVAVQRIEENGEEIVAMFELSEQDGELKLVEERHFQLVRADKISDDDLKALRAASRD